MYTLRSESRAVKRMIDLMNSGKYPEALKVAEGCIKRFPKEAIFYDNAASLCFKFRDVEKIKFYAEKALSLKGDLPTSLMCMSFYYAEKGYYDPAIQSAKKCLEIDKNNRIASYYLALSLIRCSNFLAAQKVLNEVIPSTAGMILPELIHLRGLVMDGLRKFDDAERDFKFSINLNPSEVSYYNSLGNLYVNQRRISEAADCFLKCIEVGREKKKIVYPPYWNYIRSKKVTVRDYAIVEEIQNLYVKPDLDLDNKGLLAFCLGKIYADFGDKEMSFSCYTAGNALQKREAKYNYQTDVDRTKVTLLSQPRKLNTAYLGESRQDDFGKVPIFVVGMPRSGTSLTEQILSSHSSVDGLGEISALNIAETHLVGGMARNLKMNEKIKFVRDFYFKTIKSYAPETEFFVDKMPTNFRYLGWISNAFPEAKIIHTKRQAEAVCFSIFKQMFPASGLGWARDQEDIARYYKMYEGTVAFFEQAFPDRIYTVEYEKLTENPELEISRLLEYCGLTVEEACFNSHKTKRVVATASHDQVNRKIFTGSSDVWREYEEFLGPMLNILRGF